jgi:hypothetical protein
MSAEAERWLQGFPETTHATLRSWFAYAITSGARTPEAILMVVMRLVGHKLDWATTPETRQLCHNTLQACVCNRPGALAYAGQVMQEGPPA